MKIKTLAVSIALMAMVAPTSLFATSIKKAAMLNKHGLSKEAKVELINVVFSESSDSSKAQAYYMLGSIAFEENEITTALDSWRDLSRKYPNSKQAQLVKDRINELAEIVGESAKESIQNAVALSYLRHGDFWSRRKRSRLTIDTYGLPQPVEASIKWYDKVISEFPNSTASRVAYQNKIYAILGWRNPGDYGAVYGIWSAFDEYMPLLLTTFTSFEKDHPKASTLQAFRYQIAQTYRSNSNYGKTREWLNLVIQESGEGDSFYKDLATRRLKRVEHEY